MIGARIIRRFVSGMCAVAIAGMIVSSINSRTGAALAFGLLGFIAIACLMVATAVAPGGRPASAEDEAARVEALVHHVVSQGAEEPLVRSLVSSAVRLGRARGEVVEPSRDGR